MPALQSNSTPVFYLVTNQMRYKRVHIATTSIQAIQSAMGEVDYVLPSEYWSAEQVHCYAEANGAFASKRLTVLVRQVDDGFTETQSVVISTEPLSPEYMTEQQLVAIAV